MVLELRRVHSVLRIICRVLVQVGHKNGLTVGRLDVLSRAAIAVTTSADFLYARAWSQLSEMLRHETRLGRTYKVERAVDFVKLGTENGSKEVGHVCGSVGERTKCGDNRTD